jgi:predicted carbohydrate-binding protein with CBM5 and CBM33 domain
MFVRPRLAHLVTAGLATPLLTVAVAGAAVAHGAPLDPVSRSAACGSAGRFTQTAACTAARAGDEGRWFRDWDNVRVADVNGRDRETIPDGRLCSGGIEGFGGLDRPRSDWPSTSVRAGKTMTVSYRATIPHTGSFRIYVTTDGYNPKRALRWADLEAKPFLTVKDPAFNGSAYTFKATLPSGKVGRHLLYTVWQNSSTADTYYSCSDVVFAKPARAATTTRPAPAVKATPAVKAKSATKDPRPTPTPSRSSSPSVTAEAVPTTAAPGVSLGPAEKLSTEVGGNALLPMLAAAGLLVLAGSGGAVVVARRRRRRAGRTGRRH